MPTVNSADGTRIGYDRAGTGPAVVLVDGAMCYRGGPLRPLAEALQDRFTVYTYDRRGRGESGDTPPYAVDREVEDLQAVVRQAGGRAYAYAMSSGGALAMAAAAVGSGLTKLAVFEPPFMAEAADGSRLEQYGSRLRELLAAGQRGEAVALFMATVGVPPPVIAGMRAQPGWAAMEAIAPTLAYDDELLGDGSVPRGAASTIAIPALVLAGGNSPRDLQRAAEATAEALPAARLQTLEGQTHDVAAEAVAPVLIDFFTTEA